MSVLNHSGEEQAECPLCMEPLEVDDLNFYPCTCGYQICRFCWNRIREGENGLCPACRKAYPENPADFTPLSQEQVAAIKTEKKAREQRRRNKTLESRRQLANVRVVQKNLVFVVGLPVRLADPEILKRQEYFGKYGKIHKVVINQSTTYAGSQGPSASAYVTYLSQADALRAIQSVNNVTIDGRVLKGSLGTTKYCANFMKNQTCPKTDCMYLHELGDSSASFTKDQMHQGLHQIYERKLHNQLLAQTQKEQSLAQQQQDKTIANSSGTSTNCEKHSSKEGNQPGFIPTTIVTSSNINIVNSYTKSKKDQSMSSLSSGGSKEAWPSLGSSPPNSDSSGSKQASPKPLEASPSNGHHAHTHSATLSQENSTPESPSPTQQSQSKHKEGKRSREQQQSTNGNSKSSNGTANGNSNNKNEQKKWKKGIVSINDGSDDDAKQTQHIQERTPFESRDREYDLDQLESDHHGLLDNHDLLDSSDHSLLDDDSHNLLNDTNSDALMMQRHREMLASLVDNNHLMGQQMKAPLVDSFGLLDAYDRPLMEQKELLQRERNRSEMLMRQNEMMARHHNLMQPKHYLHSSSAHSIGLESANDLLGANYPNTSMLPPFGVRLDGTVPNNVHNYGIIHNSRPLPAAAASAAPAHHLALKLNGYAEPQEGRYLGENMDKFFTDFHKAQQLKYLLTKGVEGASLGAPVSAGPSAPPPHAAYADSRQQSKFGRYHAPPHNMMSAHQLEMEQKQRHQEMSAGMGGVSSAGGASNVGGVPNMGGVSGASANKRPVAVDDDLDFDPFKETQKAFAEMMESELQQNGLSPSESAERIRRSRLPPPGFSAMNAFGLGAGGAAGAGAGGAGLMQRAPPPLQQQTQQDWTQMDPAIMSTSVNFPHKPSVTSAPPELFQRFSQLTLPSPPSNYSKLLQLQQQRLLNGQTLQNGQYLNQHKLGGWSAAFPAGDQSYSSIPLPPGFSDLAAAPTGAEIESK